VRITKIELKDFRAFKGHHVFDLHRAGHNLLVYGENGSGKSSLIQALDRFLATTQGSPDFRPHQNIFVTTDDGYVKIHLDDPTAATPDPEAAIYEWSATANPVGKRVVREAAKTRGVLDYRALLRTYFLYHGKDTVNLFHLLVEGLLAEIPNPANNRPFGPDWNQIKELLNGRLGWRKKQKLDALIADFNAGWATTITGLQVKAREILSGFGYPIQIEMTPVQLGYRTSPKRIAGDELVLKANYCGRDIGRHQDFLNEAKLSAIALSIYFGALLQLPASKLRLLLLDDVLIGLDMVNRFPVIDILRRHFSDFQILFTTYDREWFETVHEETKNGLWSKLEITCGRCDGYDLPVVAIDSSYMAKAETFLNAGEYGAAANYLRKETERILKKYCNKHRVQVRFSKKLEANDLWEGLCSFPNPDDSGQLKISPTQKASVERYRRVVLNPGSHDDSARPLVEPEVRAAVLEVKQLEANLFPPPPTR
jgi:energy-coupling factor transporter ATP-binding protein EcfA2